MRTGKIKLLSNEEINYTLNNFKLEDGKLFRKLKSGRWKEFVNKVNQSCGYCQLQLAGRRVYYHRIVYILHNKKDVPEGMMLDHISGDRLNNNIDNLRVVDQRQNNQNTYKHRSGKLVGSSFHKPTNKWMAYIKINKIQITLGYHNTEQQAHNQYNLALQHIDKYQNPKQFRAYLNSLIEPSLFKEPSLIQSLRSSPNFLRQ